MEDTAHLTADIVRYSLISCINPCSFERFSDIWISGKWHFSQWLIRSFSGEIAAISKRISQDRWGLISYFSLSSVFLVAWHGFVRVLDILSLETIAFEFLLVGRFSDGNRILNSLKLSGNGVGIKLFNCGFHSSPQCCTSESDVGTLVNQNFGDWEYNKFVLLIMVLPLILYLQEWKLMHLRYLVILRMIISQSWVL